MNDVRILDLTGLQSLIDGLLARGYDVVGPTVRDGAIVPAPVRTIDDLPRGWGDEQDAAHYRLRRRDDDALFGFAAGAQSPKSVFFPASELIWRGRRTGEVFTVDEHGPSPAADDDAADRIPAQPVQPVALVGVRSCDLHALAIHDTVLTSRNHVDVRYAARRADTFVVAATCSDPGGTCFCASMGTGPRPDTGFDLSLTELLDGGPHRFLVEVGTERGAEVLAGVPSTAAPETDVHAADDVATRAVAHMGRTLDTDGLKDVLYANAENPRWDDVASRCLSCTNCTLVCPTCFCTSVEDVADLSGDVAERLAAAVELARALHRLPPRLVLVGVEVADVEPGAELSTPVQEALDGVVDAVVALVSPGVSADVSW